jgi:hypothetical protein
VDTVAARQAALRAIAPLALMGLIFFLSDQPDLDSGLGTLDFILRKLAHMTEYALLTALWAWALHPLTRLNLAIAATIAILYAISDEYHQTFVTGRSGTVRDVIVDALGVGIAIALLRYHRPLRAVAGERGSGGGQGGD